ILLQGAMEPLAAGEGAGTGGGGAGPARRADPGGGRRHRGRAQRQEGVRQRVSSRCGAIRARLDGAQVGTSLGGAFDPGEVSVRLASLGAARAVCPLPSTGDEQQTEASPQSAFANGPVAAGSLYALATSKKVHFPWRWTLFRARA